MGEEETDRLESICGFYRHMLTAAQMRRNLAEL